MPDIIKEMARDNAGMVLIITAFILMGVGASSGMLLYSTHERSMKNENRISMQESVATEMKEDLKWIRNYLVNK